MSIARLRPPADYKTPPNNQPTTNSDETRTHVEIIII
jgi:hypothetical protein